MDRLGGPALCHRCGPLAAAAAQAGACRLNDAQQAARFATECAQIGHVAEGHAGDGAVEGGRRLVGQWPDGDQHIDPARRGVAADLGVELRRPRAELVLLLGELAAMQGDIERSHTLVRNVTALLTAVLVAGGASALEVFGGASSPLAARDDAAHDLMLRSQPAGSILGSLGNFDVVNNSGHDAHGFQIEFEGLQLADVVYTFSMQRYGGSTITPTPTVEGVPYTITQDTAWVRKNATGAAA